MGRRGRSASPPPATRRMAPAPRQSPPPQQAARPSPPPQQAVAHAPPQAMAPQMAAPSQGPGLMAQMATTAGGVAIGSVVGHAITGMMSGDKHEAQPAQAAAPAAPQPLYGNQPQQSQTDGPCGWQMKQFMECAQSQQDISLCQGYQANWKDCKAQYNI